MNIEEILSQFEPKKENLLAVLHRIQEEDAHNHVSSEAMKRVASFMKLPLSSVYGVLHYYSMYSMSPRGKHIIRVCNSVVCKMLGSDVLKEEVEAAAESYSVDECNSLLFTVEMSECLGHCELSPVMMIDEDIHGHIKPEEVKTILGNQKNQNK